MLEPKVFQAYDVRGIYPADLDEDGAYAIGRAYVEQFEPKRIAVGRDMRLASPSVAAALIDGAADGGADVVDVGMVGTEMVYFAVGELALDGGVMVTASHNPGEYIGMKIVRRGALPVGSESGLYDVRDRAVRGAWREAKSGSGARGDAYDPLVGRRASFVRAAAVRPGRGVIDAAHGNGRAGPPPRAR